MIIQLKKINQKNDIDINHHDSFNKKKKKDVLKENEYIFS